MKEFLRINLSYKLVLFLFFSSYTCFLEKFIQSHLKASYSSLNMYYARLNILHKVNLCLQVNH